MKSKDKLISVVEKIARKENKSPETVVSELNNMSEEQINNKLKMINIFKEGGKLDYLLCLKKGGTVKDCGCGGNVEKKAEGGQTDDPRNQISWQKPVINGSDTTARGVNPYGQQFIARGTSDGRSLERITDTGSTGPIKTVWKQNPSLLDRILGVKKLTQDLDPILMQQDGGELSKRDMFRNAERNKGMSKKQARQAYRNAKSALRNNGPDGLKGNELRQAAMHAFDADMINDIAHNLQVPIISENQNVAIAPKYTRSYNNGNFNGLSFNDAFKTARGMGMNKFGWNGNQYTTKYKEEIGQNKPVVSIKPEVSINSPVKVKPVLPGIQNPTIRMNSNVVTEINNPIERDLHMKDRNRILSDANLIWPEIGQNVIYKPE